MIDFGDQLKHLRIRAGLTQSDLAEACDLGQSTISALETGRQNPWPSTRRALARAFRMSLEQFDAQINGAGWSAPAGLPSFDRDSMGMAMPPEYPRGAGNDSLTSGPGGMIEQGRSNQSQDVSQVGGGQASRQTAAAFPYASAKVMDLLNQLGQAEHQLDQYRSFVQHVCAACWTTDATLHLTGSFGPVAAEQRNRHGDFQGRHVTEFFAAAWGVNSPNFQPLVMQEKAADGLSVSYVWELEGRRYMVFVDPIRDSAGRVTGTVGMAVDATDRQVFGTARSSG